MTKRKSPSGRYVWDGKDWCPREEYVRPVSKSANVHHDIPEYISPVTMKSIHGRAERREDLRKAGARETDPSEFTPTYSSDKHERAEYERRGNTSGRVFSFPR